MITLRAGGTVPDSGTYQVFHNDYHVQPHTVICIKDDTFPQCPGCSGFKTEFVLVAKVPHVLEHSAFMT
jgi:Zn-dependent M16 (insulinase) family peptidase